MSDNIVITMAGRGSRFYQAGYKEPKYAIHAHGHSLFYWSMKSLAHFITGRSRLVFVCLAENNSGSYIREECAALGLKNVHIHEVPELTDGQATSAYVSRHLWIYEQPLLVYNIDTYVNPRSLNPQDIQTGSDGWIPCFRVPGTHWSFVDIDAEGWARDVAEKTRISDYASIGLYWFARAGNFVSAYDEFFADPKNLVKGERYIAPLYRHLILNGKRISISDLPVEDVHVLGTPDELKVFLSKDPATL
jgi:dTDP-glucose pyrophosphorylase